MEIEEIIGDLCDYKENEPIELETTIDELENVNVIVDEVEEETGGNFQKEVPAMVRNEVAVKGKDPVPVEKRRRLRLPLARVKHIMKMDLDCTVISQDSIFLVTKATEMFLEYLGREAIKHTQTGKRKTLQKRDVDAVIDSVANLCFLEGALD